MYRSAIENLKSWKQNKNRKPLIIRGARQVGKTWLMKTFGDHEYKKTVYINFDNNPLITQLFSLDMNIQRIITGIEIYVGFKIDADNTLLIFDEIQEVPQALTSLKYFNEEASEYQIICAGSLLGVALHEGTSFPVGKVEFLDLYPLSFIEFIQAMGKEQYAKLLINNDLSMANTFKQNYIELLKYYYFVGGMPEAVQSFVNHNDFNKVRTIQKNILNAYEQDFSKHAPSDIVFRIRMLWNSIPAQLAKENKKFIYGLIKSGSRAKEYEIALMWLIDCGLVHKVQRVTTPSIPLKAYEDLKAFKLFILDVGLLGCITNLDQSILINGNELFKEFKGALSEQYVLQQLKTIEHIETYYWTNDRGSAEINFLLDVKNKIIPLEVEAKTNSKAKALKVFYERYSPNIAIRTSMMEYKQEDWLLHLPLWAIATLTTI